MPAGEAIIVGGAVTAVEEEIDGDVTVEGSAEAAEPGRVITPEEGIYRLICRAGETSLHVMDDSLQEGALFDLKDGSGASRRFMIRNEGSGYSIRCTTKSGEKNYWLSIMDDSGESGAWLCQRREDGSDRQYFCFFEAPGGNVFIRSAADTWLDAASDGTSPSGIRLRAFSGTDSQMWRLERVQDQGEMN